MTKLFTRRNWLLLGLLGGLTAATAGTAQAQAPAWQAAAALSDATAGSNSRVTVTASAADAAGNVYLTGFFAGSMQVAGSELVSSGNDDIFVAKWSGASRRFAWALRAGDSDTEQALGLAVSGTSIYLAGFFYGTTRLGGYTLRSAGESDGFVAKLTDAGSSASFGWAQAVGGAAYDELRSVAAAGSAVYVAGFFQRTVAVGATQLSSAGEADVLVAGLTDTGPAATVAWARQAGGPQRDEATALALGPGGAYVLGSFNGTATFGSTSLTSTGTYNDLFISKIAVAGAPTDFSWTQPLGGTGAKYGSALAVSGTSVYVGGSFLGTLGAGSARLTSAGFSDGFVVKLTDAGATAGVDWADRLGGAEYDEVRSLAAVGAHLYAGGTFKGTAQLGPRSVASDGGFDGFVLHYPAAPVGSSASWVQTLGGPSDQVTTTLAISGTQVYAGGYFGGEARLGSQVISAGNARYAGFLAVLADQALPTTAPALSAGLSVYPNPARELATVELPAGAGPAQLTLRDALGRVVRTQPAGPGPSQHLSLAGLPRGVYQLQVQQAEAVAVQQLVVD